MMASSSDRDRDHKETSPKPDNTFIQFRQYADSKISSLLQGIIGLPSAFTKNPNNTRWSGFDDDMRRRDELQARQKELKDSEARKAEQWTNSDTGAMDDTAANDLPLYSPVSRFLFAHLPVAKSDVTAGTEWPQSDEDNFLRLVDYPEGGYQKSWDPMVAIQNATYTDLNSHTILRSKSSLLPYILFSPYSPMKMEMEALKDGGRDTLAYGEAFRELILISHGPGGADFVGPPRRAVVSNNTKATFLNATVGPERSWIYGLWAGGLLQEESGTPVSDCSSFHSKVRYWMNNEFEFSGVPENEEAETEQDVYDRFLRRASSPLGVAETLESLFTDTEGWIGEQMASLEPAIKSGDPRRLLKELTGFLDQKTGDEVEDKKRADAIKTLETIFEQTMALLGKHDSPEKREDAAHMILQQVMGLLGVEGGQHEPTARHARATESFSGTKVGKELKGLKRRSPADLKAVSESTTETQTWRTAEGSVHTSVTVWKRFADGRETTTTTSHIEEPAYGDRANEDDENDFLEQTGFPKPAEKTKGDKGEKKGWFWS